MYARNAWIPSDAQPPHSQELSATLLVGAPHFVLRHLGPLAVAYFPSTESTHGSSSTSKVPVLLLVDTSTLHIVKALCI